VLRLQHISCVAEEYHDAVDHRGQRAAGVVPGSTAAAANRQAGASASSTDGDNKLNSPCNKHKLPQACKPSITCKSTASRAACATTHSRLPAYCCTSLRSPQQRGVPAEVHQHSSDRQASSQAQQHSRLAHITPTAPVVAAAVGMEACQTKHTQQGASESIASTAA
jgi:hypothetical protein